jgi:hypothetical protein
MGRDAERRLGRAAHFGPRDSTRSRPLTAASRPGLNLLATAWPIGNARSQERNIADRIGFDAYSSYEDIERILDPVDKPI